MDCPPMSYRGGLQHLTTVALSLKSSAYAALCKVNKPPTSQHDASESFAVPPLFLHEADPITSSLISAGCPPLAAPGLSDAFLRSARQIRAAYQSTYSQTCKHLTHNTTVNQDTLYKRLSKLGSALERQYRDRITAAEKLAVSRVQSVQQPQTVSSKSKPIFNQEFTPFLEKYFEYNAYPSAPDRAALARKSMMTPRQIEVWFQNHRNRAKKEGVTLRRLTLDPLPLKLSLESLEKKMPFFIIPEKDRKAAAPSGSLETKSRDDEIPSDEHHEPTTNELSTFSLEPPSHAFPTVYSSARDSDPFARNAGKHSFPPPVWVRTPTASPIRRQAPDFDEFVLEFSAKLVIMDSSKKSQRKDVAPDTGPWFSATHTIPSPAPHPALIRRHQPTFSPRMLSTHLQATPAPPSRLHPFRSPSPESEPTRLSPSSQGEGSVRRKVARLPRRIPKNASLAHRGVSPPVSDTSSPSRSLSSSSRASSFTSDSSSSDDRRPSSSSSSSSSTSSTLTTPLLGPISLSESFPRLNFHDEGMFRISRHSFLTIDAPPPHPHPAFSNKQPGDPAHRLLSNYPHSQF